jgi:hypothetical protein
MDTATHSAFEAPTTSVMNGLILKDFSARVIIAGLKNLPGFRVPQMSPPVLIGFKATLVSLNSFCLAYTRCREVNIHEIHLF